MGQGCGLVQVVQVDVFEVAGIVGGGGFSETAGGPKGGGRLGRLGRRQLWWRLGSRVEGADIVSRDEGHQRPRLARRRRAWKVGERGSDGAE